MIRKIPRKYFKILDWVNESFEKNEKSIFLYSNLGFRDNVKAMYDYFINDERFREYKIICSLNNYEQYLENVPENVTFVSNIKGIRYFLKSKYCFYCFGKYPIKPSKNQIVVNLWHGMPLKTIGNMQKGNENVKYNYFTYVLATSDFYREIMKKSFKCEEKQVLICGQPRNDSLFLDNSDKMKVLLESCQKDNCNIDINSISNIITWLPTYRDSEDNSKLPLLTSEGLKNINETLKEKNSIILIKPHPLANLDCEIYNVYSNIFVCSQDNIDKLNMSIYDMLSNSSALITDYSSVYFDYLLLNRPIGFTIEDMSKYKEDRGFVFDNPEEYMPGMKIQNQDNMIKFINDVVLSNDEYIEERKKINDVVNYYKTGNSCEELCKKIGLLK